MNIESAILSSLPPSSGAIESQSPLSSLSTDGGVTSEGFSGALVAQIELLNNLKTGDSLPLQAQVSDPTGLGGAQGAAGLTVGKIDVQNLAVLPTNDVSASYTIDADHEAALAAVNDTLNYISGAAAGEQATAEQSMKDALAATAPADQTLANIALAEAEQGNMSTQMDLKPTGNEKPNEQSNMPTQMDLKPTGDKKPDKKLTEGETQTTIVDDSHITDGLLAGIVLPAIMPIDQGKPANNLAPTDADKEDVLSDFIKPLTGDAKLNQLAKASETGDAKPNQLAKASDNVLQSETAFRLPNQDKQEFNLKYFENAGHAEKTGRFEQQLLSLDGEKALPRVGADTTALNRAIIDNKADVPAITKPLSHPEWSKDLGERIVWMSSRAIPTAEIRLNPEHLGPISVRVNVADEQATVVFTAQHADTREALEASIPKLREMMGNQQLNLVDVNISQGTASDQGRSQAQNFSQQTADGRWQAAAVNGSDEVEQEIESGQAVVSKGLLSIYA